MQTSDWEFPLAIGDTVRVTNPQVQGYYGLDGIIEDIDYDTATAGGPSIVCKIKFPNGRTNTIARYVLTFISAKHVCLSCEDKQLENCSECHQPNSYHKMDCSRRKPSMDSF